MAQLEHVPGDQVSDPQHRNRSNPNDCQVFEASAGLLRAEITTAREKGFVLSSPRQ